MRRTWGLSQVRAPTTWGADWDCFGTADRCHHTLYPCPRCNLEILIITLFFLSIILLLISVYLYCCLVYLLDLFLTRCLSLYSFSLKYIIVWIHSFVISDTIWLVIYSAFKVSWNTWDFHGLSRLQTFLLHLISIVSTWLKLLQ